MRTSLVVVVTIMLFAAVVATAPGAYGLLRSAGDYLASVFFVDSVTASGLRTTYDQALSTGKKVKVLIVPGHEPTLGGAEYLDMRERTMTPPLAAKIAERFKADPRFEVMVARDASGWNPALASYFASNGDSIVAFTKAKKAEMRRLVSANKVSTATAGVMHGTAVPEIAYRLYGINKWANENGVDVTIHIHFNNYPRRRLNEPGAYRGFTIYVPETQYSNAKATREVAMSVFKRLSTVASVSNLPKEDAGIVDDQDLIAVGSANSMDGVSMLIEYGYIYEPQFATEASRQAEYDKFARETFQGVQDFFLKR